MRRRRVAGTGLSATGDGRGFGADLQSAQDVQALSGHGKRQTGVSISIVVVGIIYSCTYLAQGNEIKRVHVQFVADGVDQRRDVRSLDRRSLVVQRSLNEATEPAELCALEGQLLFEGNPVRRLLERTALPTLAV